MSADRSPLTLTFVDRVEKKIKSPERERVSPKDEIFSKSVQDNISSFPENVQNENNIEKQIDSTVTSYDTDHLNNRDKQGAPAEGCDAECSQENTQFKETSTAAMAAESAESNECFIDRRESKLPNSPQDTLSPSKLLMDLNQTQQDQNGYSLSDSSMSGQEELNLRINLEDNAFQKDDASLSNYYARGFDTFSVPLADRDLELNDKVEEEEEDDKNEKTYEITSTTSVMLFQERNLFEDEKEFDEDLGDIPAKLSNYDLDHSGVPTWRSETLVAKQLAEVKAIPSFDDLPEVEVFPAVDVADEKSNGDDLRTVPAPDSSASKQESEVAVQQTESIPKFEKCTTQENQMEFTSMDGSNLSKVAKEQDSVGHVESKSTDSAVEEIQKNPADDSKIFQFTDTIEENITKYSIEESSNTVSREQSTMVLSSMSDSPVTKVGVDPEIMVTPATPRTPTDSLNRSDTKQAGLSSPSVFKIPAESYIVPTDSMERDIICEEDDENVIIHFESDLALPGSEPNDPSRSDKVESRSAVVEQAVVPDSAVSVHSENISVVDPVSALEPPPVRAIEIERKFKVTSESVEKLSKLGASLLKERKFTDIYYDDSKYSLILSDWWLRQRNQHWELKVSQAEAHEFATRYEEITDENEIRTFLINHFQLKDSADSITMSDLVQKLGLLGFATFTTTRQSFALPECSIDLDITDFGFQVGEIEVMVANESRIPAALSTIEDVAGKLGLSTLNNVPGKMSAYLFEHRLDMYTTLVNAKMLTPIPSTDDGIT